MVYLIELKIMVIKMFTQLGRKVYENSENFQKMIENVRKFQTEVITELKSTLEGFKSRLDEVEEKMSELKEIKIIVGNQGDWIQVSEDEDKV